jgi:hypothetical protein
MAKELDLLRRTLESWDNNEPNDFNDCMEEIRAFLATEKEAEPGSICLRDETGLFYYAPVYLHPPRPAEPEAEPVAWTNQDELDCLGNEVTCYMYAKPEFTEGDIPLYLHPPKPAEPSRKPMTHEEIVAAFVVTGFSSDHYRLMCFIDGIRFAEKHHGITDADV